MHARNKPETPGINPITSVMKRGTSYKDTVFITFQIYIVLVIDVTV